MTTSLFSLDMSPLTMWLCYASSQEIESISLSLESGLALWLTLINGMWWKEICVTSKGLERPCSFCPCRTRDPHALKTPKIQGHGERETLLSQPSQPLNAILQLKEASWVRGKNSKRTAQWTQVITWWCFQQWWVLSRPLLKDSSNLDVRVEIDGDCIRYFFLFPHWINK